MPAREAEELVAEIAAMDRSELIRVLGRLRCAFHLDFTDEFLESAGLARLRHIVLAAVSLDLNRAGQA